MEIKTIVTKRYGTNCYLISNSNAAAVIDPGESDCEILDFCRLNQNKEIKFIILTHCHFDHIGGVAAVKEIWNCPIIISADEAKGLSDCRINLSGYWTSEKIEIEPDIMVKNGDIINLGEGSLFVISTPGHTKGSVCYLADKTLFSGDTLFRMSVGRTDLPTADYDSLISSLKTLLELDDETRVLSGHGPETIIGFEKENNPYM
ncbi:MAG: MBL fold metallo-hydrolase [Clostridia bacterium]|nr:MBL fold metallo-hydrolase [Clostridia bacterium]